MDLFERYRNLVLSGGTNRLQRTLPALDRDFIRPDERDLSGLMSYARAAAGQLRFHTLSGQSAGDWSAMFDAVSNPSVDILPLDKLENPDRQDWPPQMALLFAAFRAFGEVQTDLNRLPARHLAHYYQDVLGLTRQPTAPDRVHVIFESIRNAAAARLEAGHLMEAATDVVGNPLTYALDREVIVTQAKVADVRRQTAQRDRQGRRRIFRADTLPEDGSWPTFGTNPFLPSPNSQAMVETDRGFAISDPVLRLAQGKRHVDIILTLTTTEPLPRPQILTNFIKLDLTGDEGWFTPDDASIVLSIQGGTPQLTVSFHLLPSAPPLIDFDPDLHGDPQAPSTASPVMRVRVSSSSGYQEGLSNLTVTATVIEVSAQGITDLIVQNDQGLLAADKPIPLFGTRPTIGSNFYIGSGEVFAKDLTGFSIHMDWQDLPEDLFGHYRQYFDVFEANLESLFRPSFRVAIDMLDGRTFDQSLTAGTGALLFDATRSQHTIAFAGTAIEAAHGGGYGPAPHMLPPESYKTGTKRGFVRLQLTGPINDDLATFGVPYARTIPFNAFGHDAFALRYANQAIAVAKHDPLTGPAPILPNTAYTPMLVALRLDYTARSDAMASDIQALTKFFGIDTFGTTQARAPAPLVPAVSSQAALHIGLQNFDAPGTVSILFQIDEGTSRLGAPPAPGDVTWSYLRGDDWVRLPASALLVDETLQFQTSGILAVSIGDDATTNHTAMPAGLTWLRAELAAPADSTAHTIAVLANAATAVLSAENLNDYAAHLENGLPADTISRLKPRVAAIRKVHQPYASFRGRKPEDDPNFFERVSERLRHRARAVTCWDIERMILNRFPGVFKVRCLAHSDATSAQTAGDAAVVIVPDLSNQQSSNRLEPRAGEMLMQEIRAFTDSGTGTGITTPFARLHVIHPVFERVLVDAAVVFRTGFDAGFYSEQLNIDLQRFLSPWAFEEGRDIAFGTRIYRSELLKFIEDRGYVDYVTRFDLYHAFDGPRRDGVGIMEIGTSFLIGADPSPSVAGMQIGNDFVVGRPLDAAISTRPDAILVSHPAHRIEPILPGNETCAGISTLGIGYMIVGLDLDVTAP